MITVISTILLNGFLGGPSSMLGWLGYMFCCMPFFIDMFISLNTAYEKLMVRNSSSGNCTVEEISPNEENFISQNHNESVNSNDAAASMVDPSDRLVPESIARIEPLNNLLTSNWKENAVSTSNTINKQLMAAALIASYFYLGSNAVASGENVSTGAVTLAYASSSLLGYFGIGNMPLAKLARVNGVSLIAAVMGLTSMFTGGFGLTLFAMIALHLYDAY